MGLLRPPGPMELIIILVIVMIIFGVGKLPEIGGSMGKAIREYRKSQSSSDTSSSDITSSDTSSDETESESTNVKTGT